MTIKDIARIANVSVSTVSYALRNDSRISPATRDKIQSVAKEIGYTGTSGTPKISKKKSKGETKTIGFYIHDTEGAFFISLIRAFRGIFESYDYDFVVHTGDTFILHDWMDGMIVLNNKIDDASIREAADAGIPVILMDRELSGNNIQSVVADNFHCMYEITKRVLARGCRKIIFVGGSVGFYDHDARYKGYQKALEDADDPSVDATLIRGDCTYASGFNSAGTIHASIGIPDAFICVNDEMAMGVIDYYSKLGVKVPDQMYVTGFDGIAVTSPKYNFLTAYPQNANWANSVAYLLIEIIENGFHNPENIIFPMTISSQLETSESPYEI